MIPLLTAAEMRRADAIAVECSGQRALVERAGFAVGHAVRGLLDGAYGQRIAVVAGPGLNGADGRVAGQWLAARGAQVTVIDALAAPARLDGFDAVIDAAFGLGSNRPYDAPAIDDGAVVVAVDLPSGVDADSGAVLGRPATATVTVALGALKPAHLIEPAARFVGELCFDGLGIVESARDGLVEDGDLVGFVRRWRTDHKWRHAVTVVAGSATMPGAAQLATRGALAGGASMVRAWVPGAKKARLPTFPPEVVHVVADYDQLDAVDLERSAAVVVGPGLGRGAEPRRAVRALVDHCRAPMVLDADALHLVRVADLVARDRAAGPCVLTPHDGEFAALSGQPPGDDRLAAARQLAEETACVVLLKGPTTVVASPDGALRVVTSGTPALATAGTGDVLAGMIGAALARGHAALDAAALSAHAHGRASRGLGPYATAHELADALPPTIAELCRAG